MHVDYSWLVVLLLLTFIVIRNHCGCNYFDIKSRLNVAAYSTFLVISSTFIGLYSILLVYLGFFTCASVPRMYFICLFALYLLWGGINTWKMFIDKIKK